MSMQYEQNTKHSSLAGTENIIMNQLTRFSNLIFKYKMLETNMTKQTETTIWNAINVICNKFHMEFIDTT